MLPTRPFKSAHWTITVVFVLAWTFSLIWDSRSCGNGSLYGETALATATIFVSLWTNHIQCGFNAEPRAILRIVGGCLYDILTLFLICLVLSFPVFMLSPIYDCMTPRAYSTVLLREGSALKQEIERRASQNHGLVGVGAGLTVAVEREGDVGVVLRDGTIVLANATAMIILEPSYKDSLVTWSCQGYPSRNVPVECRRPSSTSVPVRQKIWARIHGGRHVGRKQPFGGASPMLPLAARFLEWTG